MGRTLQKKKNKSGIARVTQKPKSKKSLLLSNQVVAANWDKNQTLAQNYRRLGLASRLNGHTGGVDRHALPTDSTTADAADGTASTLDIKTLRRMTKIVPTEVRIERDPETGAILRVLEEGDEESDGEVTAAKGTWRAKRDALGKVEGEGGKPEHHSGGHVGVADGGEKSEFLRQLEEDAKKPGGKKVRKQSQREGEWCEALVGKWGRNWRGMARDAELNVMQQSEGDVRKRVERWLKKRGEGGEAMEED